VAEQNTTKGVTPTGVLWSLAAVEPKVRRRRPVRKADRRVNRVLCDAVPYTTFQIYYFIQ